ncbi:MAG: metallophosphoesterase, partial [Burkholderiales bacterium]|nr:metallophosphoesterase [Burkholderiales bacterium]
MPATKSTATSSTAAIASPSAGQLRWLHLSDIHFWGKNDWKDEAARRKLITLLKDKFADGSLPKPDLIFCTGDIAQGETKPNELAAQYASAQKFFDQVLQTCGLAKERLFVVPGNHDVNRNSVNAIFQKGLRGEGLASIADSWAKQDNVFDDALKRMHEYAHFISTYLPHQHPSDDEKARLCYRHVQEINGLRIGIAGFNSAWSCYDDHDQNQLWLAGEWQFNAADTAFHDKTDVRIGLMHHPVSWLQAEESTLAKKRIRSQFHFWLHGHEHEAWVTPTDGEVMIAAGAVNAKSDSEFGI